MKTTMAEILLENAHLKNLLRAAKQELVFGFLCRGYKIREATDVEVVKAIKDALQEENKHD